MNNVKNLHVPMPPELHGALRQAAGRLGKPATTVAREAIEAHLRHLEKLATDQELEDWAREMSGTECDLDTELEAAGVELLLADEPRA